MRGAYEELVNTRDASAASDDSSDDDDHADDAREARSPAAQIGGEAAVPLGFVDWVKRLVFGLGGIATTFALDSDFINQLPSPF